MKVSPEILAVAGLAFLFLLYKVWELRGKVGRIEYVYVDTSGISSLKQRQYIDIERNKSLNFRIAGQDLSIVHLPWKIALNHVEKIVQLWGACKQLAEYETEDKVEIELRRLQFANYYFKIANHIYHIAKVTCKKKRAVKKALRVMAENDIEGIMDITEKIVGYWMPLKKKRDLLAMGETLQSMDGERYSWKSLELDEDGRIVKKPRYTLL